MIKKILILTMLIATTAFAQIKDGEAISVPYIDFEIKEDKGSDVVQANCLMCHSFGYMINQGPRSKDFWEKKTLKMINVFKAPIAQEDVETIADYLYRNYGNGKLK